MASPSGSSRSWVVVALAILGSAVFIAIAWYLFYPDRITSSRGEQYERTEASFGEFDLRITAYHEKTTGFALPGGIFVVETRRSGDPWVEIYQTGHDDPIPIPFKAVSVTPERLYLWGERELLVTNDRGKSWKAWTTERDLAPGLRDAEYLYIKSVNLDRSGSGTMVLFSFLKATPAILRTEDGGNSWKPSP